MQVTPYVFFDGRCEEALNFYVKALGAEVTMKMLFKDSPDPAACPGAMGDKIMHAEFKVGESKILASDGRAVGKPVFEGFALSLTLKTVAESEKAFAALLAGGKVTMPLSKTFWSPSFGMLADQFGVHWMIYVLPESK